MTESKAETGEMIAVVIPDTEMRFLLASLALALEVYQAARNDAAVRRLTKINKNLLHQSGINPPSRYMAFLGQRHGDKEPKR